MHLNYIVLLKVDKAKDVCQNYSMPLPKIGNSVILYIRLLIESL